VQWFLHGFTVPGRLLPAIGFVSPSVGAGRFFRVITFIGVAIGVLANWDAARVFLRAHHLLP